MNATTSKAPGRLVWAIAEGYIPGASTGAGPELESHEAAPQSRIVRTVVYTFHARVADRW